MSYVGCIVAVKVTKQGGREVILREPFTVDSEIQVEELMAKKPKKTSKGKSKKGATKKGEKTSTPAPPAPVSSVLVAPIYLPINMRLAGVFGEFSSLEVGIHLPIYGNLTDFEKKIDEAMPRIVGKLQGLMNQITVGSGFGPCWTTSESNPPAQTPAPAGMGPAPQGQTGPPPTQQFGQQQGQPQGQQQSTAQPGPTGSSVAGFPPSPGQQQQG